MLRFENNCNYINYTELFLSQASGKSMDLRTISKGAEHHTSPWVVLQFPSDNTAFSGFKFVSVGNADDMFSRAGPGP